jgi:hypothetical protein
MKTENNDYLVIIGVNLFDCEKKDAKLVKLVSKEQFEDIKRGYEHFKLLFLNDSDKKYQGYGEIDFDFITLLSIQQHEDNELFKNYTREDLASVYEFCLFVKKLAENSYQDYAYQITYLKYLEMDGKQFKNL